MKALVLAGLLGVSLNAGAQESVTAEQSAAAEQIDATFADSSRCQSSGKNALFGPTTVASFHDAELARARRSCVRSEAGFGLRVAPVIDTPDFYGNIQAAGELYGSYALSDRLEVFGALELARFDYVVNATLTSTQVSLGHATAGIAWNAVNSDELMVTPIARVVLPTSFVSQNVRTTGIELGAAASYLATGALELHAHVGVQGTAGLSSGPALPTGGAFATVGLSFAPFSWGAVVLDLQAHAFERDTLDYVAPTFALRFNPWRKLQIEAGAGLPLLGADRRMLIGGLRAGWAY